MADCHAGAECGYCLRRLDANECPREVRGAENGGVPPCEPGSVAPGKVCEGDGPCGTSERTNNCEYSILFGAIPFDYYIRMPCDTHTDAPSQPPPVLPPPPARSPSPHPPHTAGAHPPSYTDSYDAVEVNDLDPYDGDFDSSPELAELLGRGGVPVVSHTGPMAGDEHEGASPAPWGGLLLVLTAMCCCYCLARPASGNGRTAAIPGMVPALESSRPWRWNDVTYKLAAGYSHVSLMREEAGNFNLLTREGRAGFISRMRAHALAREKEETEDLQEML